MAVTYLPQQKLYRANKKIDKVEHQEYYKDATSAKERQDILDMKFKSSEYWKLRNTFVQTEDVRDGCTGGENIGIRHVYLRIQRTRSNSGTLYPAIQVSAFRRRPERTYIKSFTLSTYGWPEAAYEAVRYAHSILPAEDTNSQDLIDAYVWLDRNKEALGRKLWGMFSTYPEPVYLNNEIVRGGQLMFIKLRPSRNGGLSLRTTLANSSKSVTINNYPMLFETAAYFVALQLIHREFKDESLYRSYAMGIYLLLKGEWMTRLLDLGIGCQDAIDDRGYDIDEWIRLVNQWCIDEYGSSLI